MATLSAQHVRWLEEARGLDPELAARYGVVSKGPSVGIEYRRAGAVVYTKWRDLKKTRHWIEPSGVRPSFWNLDCLEEAPRPDTTLIITEGEWDALAVLQAGFTHVLSVPNGSPGTRTEGDIDITSDTPYQWIWDAEAALAPFRRIVLWTDYDDPGEILRDELVPRLGPARCWAVPATDGCKDANDVLRAGGVEAVRARIAAAQPIMPDHIVGLMDLPDRGTVVVYESGWPEVDRHAKFTRPEFVVITGAPGSGKSQWMRALGGNLSFRGDGSGLRGLWLTPEDPARRLKRDFARMVQHRYGISADPIEHERRRRLISDRIKMIAIDDETPMTWAWVKTQIEMAALRHGCEYVVLDPWNEIVHDRGGRSETEYIGDAIIELKRIARRFNLIVFVVAHPKKPEPGAQITLYDISGSANWFNKADHGIVVRRKGSQTGRDLTIVHVQKSKDWETLGVPGRVKMVFQKEAASFAPAIGNEDDE